MCVDTPQSIAVGNGAPAGRIAALLAGLAAGLSGLALSPASSQVIEIGGDGGVVLHSGPSVHTPSGAAPVLLAGTAPRGPGDTTPAPARAPARIAGLLEAAGAGAQVSPELLEAVAYVESRFTPGAVSGKGAVGLMQLMPGTAADLGVDPTDAAQNASGGARYLAAMLRRFNGDLERALAAYNAGPGAVERHGGPPPYAETRAYVAAVMDYLAALSAPEAEP